MEKTEYEKLMDDSHEFIDLGDFRLEHRECFRISEIIDSEIFKKASSEDQFELFDYDKIFRFFYEYLEKSSISPGCFYLFAIKEHLDGDVLFCIPYTKNSFGIYAYQGIGIRFEKDIESFHALKRINAIFETKI